MEDIKKTKKELVDDASKLRIELKRMQEGLKETKDELETQAWGLGKTNEAIKLLYKDLEEKNRRLRELDQLKSDFISTVSHELRTPLSITKEGISLVLDEIPGKINEKQKSILIDSKESIDRLARLINNLLDISKIEAGKIQLTIESIDMVGLIHRVVSSFGQKAKDKGLELKIGLESERIVIDADSDRMTQVFTNLIGNAMKFTEKGYVKVSGRCGENEAEFCVEDTGKGISGEDLPKVFSKFQQFSRMHGSGERGTGLGLSIAKGIVEVHKGRMWIESELGKGTKFIFTLPLKRAVNKTE